MIDDNYDFTNAHTSNHIGTHYHLLHMYIYSTNQ